MNLAQRTWATVAPGQLIVGPSGAIWHFTREPSTYGPPQVRLSDPECERADLVFDVDPAAPVTVIEGATEGPIAVLSRYFVLATPIGA